MAGDHIAARAILPVNQQFSVASLYSAHKRQYFLQQAMDPLPGHSHWYLEMMKHPNRAHDGHLHSGILQLSRTIRIPCLLIIDPSCELIQEDHFPF